MHTNFDVAVCIGRFQVFHNGQLAVIREALARASRCIIVLGSAHQARSPKNPFTWQERAEMIRLALPNEARERIDFIAIRDYYDLHRWANAVHEAVVKLFTSCSNASVVLVGYRKDSTSQYLDNFPDWQLLDIGPQGSLNATALRDLYFGADPNSIDSVLATLADKVPESTLEFLRSWSRLPEYQRMTEEWLSLRQEKAKWAGSPYPPVFVTVDTIVKAENKVLLIQRKYCPGKGLLAIPGGFIGERETIYQSAVRELAEETSLQMAGTDTQHTLKAVRVFDHPDRSQRGRVITHAYYFEFPPQPLFKVQAGDDAASAQWVAIDQLRDLEDRFHDDHFHILDSFFNLTTE